MVAMATMNSRPALTSVMNQDDVAQTALARTEGDDREDDERRPHHQARGEDEGPLHCLVRHRVALDQQLHHVRDRLQEAPGSHAVRAHPGLHIAQDLALGEGEVGDQRQDAHEEQDDDLDRRRDRPVEEHVAHGLADRLEHQRSTSPSTMSVVPMIATRSASRAPLDSSGTDCRLMNDGGRTWQR